MGRDKRETESDRKIERKREIKREGEGYTHRFRFCTFK